MGTRLRRDGELVETSRGYEHQPAAQDFRRLHLTRPQQEIGPVGGHSLCPRAHGKDYFAVIKNKILSNAWRAAWPFSHNSVNAYLAHIRRVTVHTKFIV
jgi:hypothetical protein